MPERSTKERLAAVLELEGLSNLAFRAAAGEFDDYESDHVFPIGWLVSELRAAGREDLAQRARAGEWDGTKEESEVWFEREGKGFIEGLSSEGKRVHDVE